MDSDGLRLAETTTHEGVLSAVGGWRGWPRRPWPPPITQILWCLKKFVLAGIECFGSVALCLVVRGRSVSTI